MFGMASLTGVVVWADAVPNLLIGLREGLEAGLVVSILLAAVRKIGHAGAQADQGSARTSTVQLWLGVLAAISVAGSFAAVLTFATGRLSSQLQQAVGGLLSVLAVGLVTAMVLWMRRAASTLSTQIRGDVARAMAVGAGALTLTAFLAVGREGLETTLFIWAAVKASRSTLAPVLGAATGLAIAVLVCWLLYRQAMRINLAKFFTWTAIGLMVIAAGILAYGLGDLQEAGWLPGSGWIAFDLRGHVDPNSWWVSLITGVTELSPMMTVLQVTAWIIYLVVVIPAFVRAATSVQAAPAKPGDEVSAAEAGRWERLLAAHMWPVAAAMVLVPVTIAALVIALVPSRQSATEIAVSMTDRDCAKEWTSAVGGSHTFLVDNKSRTAGEITLTDAAGAVVAEIEVIGPATTAPMTAVLGDGSYSFKCYLSGQPARASAAVQVAGAGTAALPTAVTPVTADDLTGPNNQYQDAARAALAALTRDIAAIRADLARNDIPAAKTDWFPAQMDWERVGASYNSFGDKGQAVAGLPYGLPNGVNDDDFTGLHRLEYGLYHNQPAATLLPVVDTLNTAVSAVQDSLASGDLAGNATNLPIRAHEILEDALRDHLSGIDDFGAGAAYCETAADIDITRVVLAELSRLITARSPHLVSAADNQLDILQASLRATRIDGRWLAPAQTPLPARQQVNAALGAVLETLSAVPDLLEVPKGR